MKQTVLPYTASVMGLGLLALALFAEPLGVEGREPRPDSPPPHHDKAPNPIGGFFDEEPPPPPPSGDRDRRRPPHDGDDDRHMRRDDGRSPRGEGGSRNRNQRGDRYPIMGFKKEDIEIDTGNFDEVAEYLQEIADSHRSIQKDREKFRRYVVKKRMERRDRGSDADGDADSRFEELHERGRKLQQREEDLKKGVFLTYLNREEIRETLRAELSNTNEPEKAEKIETALFEIRQMEERLGNRIEMMRGAKERMNKGGGFPGVFSRGRDGDDPRGGRNGDRGGQPPHDIAPHGMPPHDMDPGAMSPGFGPDGFGPDQFARPEMGRGFSDMEGGARPNPGGRSQERPDQRKVRREFQPGDAQVRQNRAQQPGQQPRNQQLGGDQWQRLQQQNQEQRRTIRELEKRLLELDKRLKQLEKSEQPDSDK